jgi:hypothetical protein
MVARGSGAGTDIGSEPRRARKHSSPRDSSVCTADEVIALGGSLPRYTQLLTPVQSPGGKHAKARVSHCLRCSNGS